MGCDIHLHVEFKVGGEWHHYNHPMIDRNYELFTKMAGVRDSKNIEPIALPRGLPDDASFTTRFDSRHWDTDGHSHGYLTIEEIAQLRRWCNAQDWGSGPFWFNKTFGFFFGNSLEGLLEYPDDYPEDVEDIRFVFWFDN